MCPKCRSKETGQFVNRREGLEESLLLNKCHECNCVFLTFDLYPKRGVKNVI